MQNNSPLQNQILMLKIFIILSVFLLSLQLSSQEVYFEEYRPQFHLSPQGGWMGDPNGMIFFNGKYHVLWWGHAISKDLVHWTEYTPNAMKGGPSGFGYWSGSVVVDKNNSAGFNTTKDTAMVAIYTMHYNATGFQKVGLSVSHNHVGFDYYEGNPVIATEQMDFRDPSVFWHEETNRWIMVIARAAERSIEFYASNDLKNWQFLSNFNSKGAKNQVWEVPDIFKLPLKNTDEEKWVLTCGMGPNRMQFWVGNFDGTQFTLDSLDNHNTGKNIPGEVFADFEGADWGDWTVTGTAFGTQPAIGNLPDQQSVNGFVGKGFVNSYHKGDGSTGKLLSPEFTINKKYINFLIGGGIGNSLTIKLIVEGEELFSTQAVKNQETLRWKGWNVSSKIGQKAHIEIIDNATGGWGHILIDQIVFSEVLFNTGIENANWADWGKDFYAARIFRNYSQNPNKRTVWIAWMGNWDYARDVPTSPWRGNLSLPRTLELIYDKNGYQLIQKPIKEFEELRCSNYSFSNRVINGTYNVSGFKPAWNVYELKVSFKIDSDKQEFGLNLAEDGTGKKLIIGYNASTSLLYIDRRNAGTNNFNHSFKSIDYAPIPFPKDSILDLHIFMDQTSVEVFANDYKTSMSSLVFTKTNETGISVFSNEVPVNLLTFEAWKLRSIWGNPTSAHKIEHKNDRNITLYPNPLSAGQELMFKCDEPFFIQNGLVQITNMFGSLVFKKEFSGTYLHNLKISEINNLPTGNYIIQILTDDKIQIEKLSIVNY